MQMTLPQMASMLIRVGDLVPFGKRTMYPNPMSEGGKPYQGGRGGEVVQIPGPKPSYTGNYPNKPKANYDSAQWEAQHMARVAEASKKLPQEILAKIDEFSTRMGSTPYQRGQAILDAANMPEALKAWQSYKP